MTHQTPKYTLFPYTTLFRSRKNQTAKVRRRGKFGNKTKIELTFDEISSIFTLSDPSFLLNVRKPFVRFLIRSEEHTSELQSRVDLVCRLLLEKKKKK